MQQIPRRGVLPVMIHPGPEDERVGASRELLATILGMPLTIAVLAVIEGLAFSLAEANGFRDALGPVFVIAASCFAVVLAMTTFVVVWQLIVERP